MISLQIAMAWCLAWGEDKAPRANIDVLRKMRKALQLGEIVPEVVQSQVDQLRQLNNLTYPETIEALTKLAGEYSTLWHSKIGLVYGGSTKIKQYVFEASKLQDIRGASALLDRINLIDLPAFFKSEEAGDRFPQCARAAKYCQQIRANWLQAEFPGLENALIPELIIYSTGGNILAFCPAAYADDLANAIEKRYTHETLTASSCAVGQAFRFLELHFGLLKDDVGQTPWMDWYLENATNELVQTIFGPPDKNLAQQFEAHKSFNELVRQLAVQFYRRRSGDDHFASNRPSRRYPPMFETHPHVRRGSNEKQSAVCQVNYLPNEPWFSDVEARKRVAGQKAKRDRQNTSWYKSINWLNWNPGEFESWVTRYERFLENHPHLAAQYNPENLQLRDDRKEARSLREISNASSGFVAYIYADGNSMGNYIRTITTVETYQQFSEAVFEATEHAVYLALAKHLTPHQLQNLEDLDSKQRNGKWIHPFEILTIGGDDVMLVVPANQALAIAKTISEEFERILLKLSAEKDLPNLSLEMSDPPQQGIHRYRPAQAEASQCRLNMSVGVLITADDTPIYYAENLTNQLLKSAKKKAKALKDTLDYHGGTIDFLVMKSVTMLSSKVEEFRESGLVIDGKPKLKLYGAPYTLHEIGGLLETAEALKAADFPRSQLYQIRSLLERGKHTAMLNYRYFRVRLAKDKQDLLAKNFETAWCLPKDAQNGGNLAPWMSLKDDTGTTYETIWRELVDLYPFINEPDDESAHPSATTTPTIQEVR